MNEIDERELEQKMRQLMVLTPEQRQSAKNQARVIVKKSTHGKPIRADYNDSNESKYPTWFITLILIGIFVVLVSAGTLSSFRVYESEYVYFLGTLAQQNGVTTAIDVEGFTGGINNPHQAALAGVFGFILAEFMIIVFVIASQTIAKDKKWLKRAIVILVVIGGMSALNVNIAIQQPHDEFGWLITIAPPIATIVFTEITVSLFLDGIATRATNQAEFNIALGKWELAHNQPELHPDFKGHFIAYLKLEIQAVNAVGNGGKNRKAIMESLTYNEWRYVVKRELVLSSDNFVDVNMSDTMMVGANNNQRLTNGQVPVTPKMDIADNTGSSGSNNGANRRNTPSPKTQLVIAFFKENPNRLNDTGGMLESELGVGKTVINEVQKAIRNGDITL